ncbi:unnamed protein product, partial [Arabidopsis halleri]
MIRRLLHYTFLTSFRLQWFLVMLLEMIVVSEYLMPHLSTFYKPQLRRSGKPFSHFV